MNESKKKISDCIIVVPDMHNVLEAPRWPGKYLCLYRHVTEPRRYIVGAPLSFLADDDLLFTVKPGFVTDGASVPRLLWWYASPFAGAHAAAVVLHDALYATNYKSRKECDQIFMEAMLTLPMRSAKASAMYRSVRMAGSKAWNEKKEEDIAKATQLLDVKVFTR